MKFYFGVNIWFTVKTRTMHIVDYQTKLQNYAYPDVFTLDKYYLEVLYVYIYIHIYNIFIFILDYIYIYLKKENIYHYNDKAK